MIDGFAAVKRDLVLAVDESLFTEIRGQADSEVLFYLALSFGLEDDPPGVVAQPIGLVEACGRQRGVTYPFAHLPGGLSAWRWAPAPGPFGSMWGISPAVMVGVGPKERRGAMVAAAIRGPGGAGRTEKVLGDPLGAARVAGGITLGVEEEFVLLDPATGAAALAAPDLVRMLDGEPGIQQELMRFQVEIATRVCTGLDDIGRELARLRRLVADAAAGLGCRLVASGTVPYRTPGLAALTNEPRYQELARRYSALVPDAGTCSCHVHVGVPSRDLGVQVLARLRPWLAPVLAITVNSPITGGRDMGWASWRYPLWARWPTARAPAIWPDAAAYDATIHGYIADGAALDERSVYIWARLSPRYPTVEVRVADVCLDTGTAVLVAGLTRALVTTALAEARQGTPVAAAPARWVDAGLATAARHGLTGPGIDPFTGQTVDARSLRSRLLDHVHPALSDQGDTETVTRLLYRLDDRGTGADRQRALFAAAGSAPAFVDALARATLPGDEPACRHRPNARSGQPPRHASSPAMPVPRCGRRTTHPAVSR